MQQQKQQQQQQPQAQADMQRAKREIHERQGYNAPVVVNGITYTSVAHYQMTLQQPQM